VPSPRGTPVRSDGARPQPLPEVRHATASSITEAPHSNIATATTHHSDRPSLDSPISTLSRVG
jgi:hypothetical protein